MKTYIKPTVNCIDLRSEERFAGSACTVHGSCTQQNYQELIEKFKIKVNLL